MARKNNTNHITRKGEWHGHEIMRTWIKTDDISDFRPITQVYGICFNESKEILISREPNKEWQIPGGTPESGESLQETLEREFLEEVDVDVEDIKALGVQRVEFPDNSNENEGDVYYQARFICKLKKLLPQTADPATGGKWERVFISHARINDYINWGDLGKIMFEDALEALKAQGQNKYVRQK